MLLPTAVRAAPLLGSGQDAGGLRVYRDSAAPGTFYYAPGKLSLGVDRAGLPQFSFLQMRYTGTAATGDRGAFRTQSSLTFQVKMDAASPQSLAKARAALRPAAGVEPVLRPLPIRRVAATLNYVPLKDGQPVPDPSKAAPAGNGALEESSDSSSAGSYWTERTFALGPDEATSQLLWDSFKRGRVLLSLSYTFYSDGVPPDAPVPGAPGVPGTTGSADPQKDAAAKGYPVLGDTLAITIDAARYPDRLRQIDVNESLPANYAVLSVACYDFNNSLRPDLQVKLIEIEAKSITGQPVKREVSFSKATPDLYRASVRFPFAVSLKDGYRYRAREITPAGEEKVRPWKEVRSWAQLLDVTSPAEERPVVKDEG